VVQVVFGAEIFAIFGIKSKKITMAGFLPEQTKNRIFQGF
jgi:hypothetical protein